MMFSRIFVVAVGGLALLFTNPISTSAQVFVNTKDVDGKSYDYIVSGAGTAGCVIASRIAAASNNFTVLLVERGPANVSASTEKQRRAPIFTLYGWSNNELSDPITGYPAGPKAPLVSYNMVRGKGMGGTTNVNAGAWSRPLYTDFNAWNTSGWTGSDIKSYFKKVESSRYSSSDPENHGDSGPLPISFPRNNQSLNNQFLTAIRETGQPTLVDGGNGVNNHGVWPLVTINNGGKRFTSCDAYFKMLQSVRGKTATNLIIAADSQVSKIVFDSSGTKATSVKIQSVTSSSSAAVTANVKKELIVSSGVYGSPQLLLLSGIGPSSDLKKLGISVIKDLPVGKNLVARPISIVVQIGSKQLPEMDFINYITAETYSTFAETGNGVLATPVLGVWGNLRFGPNTAVGSTDNIVGFTTVNYPGLGLSTGLVSMCLLSDPKSRGTLSLKSTDWNTHPEIQPNQFSNDDDLPPIVNCTKWLRQIWKTKALQDYAGVEFLPSFLFSTDNALASFITIDSEGFSQHAWGTIPIGNKASPVSGKTVLGEDLKILGISNVRVADTSIIPAGFSSGIMSIAYAIGEKASDMILADAGSAVGSA